MITNDDLYYYLENGKISAESVANDKYYVKPEIAKKLISLVDKERFEHIIEPSAGNGSFSLQLDCEAYDIKPEHPSIIEANFFDLSFDYNRGKTLIIGGPPYGIKGSNAINFFNHSKKFADTIAFILPKNLEFPGFICTLEVPLNNAFTIDGYEFHYPSVFQIWKRI